MNEEAVVKAVGERISGLKGLLGQSVNLLTNCIGQCKCKDPNRCAECIDGDNLIDTIEQAIKGK